jgi:hypothetical protein
LRKLNNTRRSYTIEHVAFSGTGSAYDPETGEALIYGPAETHYLRSKAQAASHNERESFHGRQAEFTFAAMEAIGEVTAVLTTAQCGFLTVLQCYVDYGTNTLINANKSPMKTADMIRTLRLERKRSTFYGFLAACIEHGIIAEVDGKYAVNPRYHFRGAARNNSVIRMYTARIKQSYDSASKAADLGLVYRMLPFVNYEMNALCSNPTERDPYEVAWLSGRELAAAIGVSETELSRRIRRITVGEEYVIARITVGGMARYMFNPLVFKRNSRPVDDTAQAMFNVKYRK